MGNKERFKSRGENSNFEDTASPCRGMSDSPSSWDRSPGGTYTSGVLPASFEVTPNRDEVYPVFAARRYWWGEPDATADPDGLNIVRVTDAFLSSRVQGDLEQIASHLHGDCGLHRGVSRGARQREDEARPN